MYRSILQGAWGLKTAPLIPNDQKTLRNLAGVPEPIWKKHGPAVLAMLDLSSDEKFYSHERLTADWKEAAKRMKENRDRASKGGKAKRDKRLGECSKSASSTAQAHPSTAYGVLEPANNNTEQYTTEQKREDAAALPPLALAQKVAEELRIRGPGLIPSIAAAVADLVEHEGKSNNSAVEFLIAHGKDAQDRGENVNRFWFDESKWRPRGVNGNGAKPNKASERGEKAAEEIRRAVADLSGRAATEDEAKIPTATGGRSFSGVVERLAKYREGGGD